MCKSLDNGIKINIDPAKGQCPVVNQKLEHFVLNEPQNLKILQHLDMLRGSLHCLGLHSIQLSIRLKRFLKM